MFIVIDCFGIMYLKPGVIVVEGAIFLTALSFFIVSGLFGLAAWTILPEKDSPFRNGFWRGIGMCGAFQLVITLILFVSVKSMGGWGFLLTIVVYFGGMRWVFNAEFLETIFITVANYLLAIGTGWLVAWLAATIAG